MWNSCTPLTSNNYVWNSHTQLKGNSYGWNSQTHSSQVIVMGGTYPHNLKVIVMHVWDTYAPVTSYNYGGNSPTQLATKSDGWNSPTQIENNINSNAWNSTTHNTGNSSTHLNFCELDPHSLVRAEFHICWFYGHVLCARHISNVEWSVSGWILQSAGPERGRSEGASECAFRVVTAPQLTRVGGWVRGRSLI